MGQAKPNFRVRKEYLEATDKSYSDKMSYSWTPMCSLTATKYQRYGYVQSKPFLPGERWTARRDMERNVRGYKELRQELTESRATVERQVLARQSVDRKIITSYYKSPVGT